jgi:DNA-directed RNA polymerase specialized sigma24 family protein
MADQKLSLESSEDLLEYIKWQKEPEFEVIAKEAFKTFTFRFQMELLKKLIPVCKNWGYDKQMATEIAYQTFDRVWKYPTFNILKENQKTPDRAILLYLLTIAKHLLADYYRMQNKAPYPFDGSEEIVRDFPHLSSLPIAVEKKAELEHIAELIQQALNRLTPKHRIIYLTYKQYEEQVIDGYKLPRNLLKKLREELNLTQSSIRVYKKEAFDMVEEYLKIYGQK